MEITKEEKVTSCKDDNQRTNVIEKIDEDVEWYDNVVCSIEELLEHETNIPDVLIDYDSCDVAIEHVMAEEFMCMLSDNEKYIVESLLNGMTHDEISDTMDCTRQNVTRCVERICKKANDFLF